jgi:HlyD family secretion protein
VLARNVEPGQIVQPGKALMTLALDGPTQLVAQVDERFLDQLRVSQSARVVADAYPSERFAARVLSISPLVDAQRGAVEVKFALEQQPPVFLREDMTLSLEVETGRRDSALVVPLSALRSPVVDQRSAVLVVEHGQARARDVRVGLRTLAAAEVLEGLSEGEVVLTSNPAPAVGARVKARAVQWRPGATTGSGKAEDASTAVVNAMGR